MFKHKESLHSAKEALQMFKDKPTGELRIKLELVENLPKIFTYQQLMGNLGLAYAVVNLIDNCKVHAGREASVVITAFFDKDFQYINIKDDGPGIKDLSNLRHQIIITGHSDHNLSSLDLACQSVSLLGGVIIPNNVVDAENIIGANFRIQIPLDSKNMNREFSRKMRQTVAKNLGLG